MVNPTTEHLDILVIGAGISGIGAGHYIRTDLPQKSFAILEGRASFGGTWDLFRYPGIRSDSDLHTFGYEFKPWESKDAIADGHKILDYLKETIDENHLADKIRYNHRVVAANWSDEAAEWTVRVEHEGEQFEIVAKWIFFSSGYYDYATAYTPEFAGRDRFTGPVVHPQFWPQDLDYAGKKVVIIGSGATAVTLVPSLAKEAEHVTMLQRTPTYIMPVPKQDELTNLMHRVLGHKLGHKIARKRYIWQQRGVYVFSQRFPNQARKVIRTVNAKFLPKGYPVDVHFNPPYNPWDQRMCAVPNGDLFKSIRENKASIATDTVKTFTETGIELASGEHLDADIIVTATGFNAKLFGNVVVTVDCEPVDLPNTVVHRGTMLSGVPNAAAVIGYTNSSWTLKVGMLFRYLATLINYMDREGYDVALPIADPAMETKPALDFAAGYVKRALGELPKQGLDENWKMSMSYFEDRKRLSSDLKFDEASGLRLSTSSRESAAV